MWFDFLMFILSLFLLIICVLISVAFLTLLERSVLGYIQIRKGPNSVGYIGMFQPFSDAIKLICSEQLVPLTSSYFFLLFITYFSLMVSLLIWLVFAFYVYMISFSYGFLFFFVLSSLGVYTMMISGWSSNSSYSLLGSLRSVAQTISYEVSLALMLLSLLLMIGGFNLGGLYNYQLYSWFVFLAFPLAFSCFSSFLAETNRTPFDFAEGESELVSGFIVEYGSGGFTLLFLSEYSLIVFMSVFFVLFFLGGDYVSFFFFKVGLLVFVFIWVRGTLPRYRYDKLMYLAWSSYLPLSLNYFLFFVGLSLFFFSFIF
uniref:NADH-ubiquinone oxidoreductase chain 1 n=1 Tax=Proscopia sp. HS-2014 TaxID=1564209 RepID=A0A0N7ARZ3_9ORTH|nr:NADH dehydrogenase subunit 1 [Proscopia sp. HS-2014]